MADLRRRRERSETFQSNRLPSAVPFVWQVVGEAKCDWESAASVLTSNSIVAGGHWDARVLRTLASDGANNQNPW